MRLVIAGTGPEHVDIPGRDYPLWLNAEYILEMRNDVVLPAQV